MSPVSEPNEIRIIVEGLPPAKGEAKSMLSAGHGHVRRVRALLEAAATAIAAQSWTIASGPIGMKIEVWAPNREAVWDATNYLGGIADVLQAKERLDETARGALGALARVALYVDDRQIHAIDYRFRSGEAQRYSVTVRTLGVA